jgi:hypothetical protein
MMEKRIKKKDKKSVESVCIELSRIVESFKNDKRKIKGIDRIEMLNNMKKMLVV